MDLFGQMKLADFYLKLYKGDLKNLNAYEFIPQKKQYLPSFSREDKLPRSIPEKEGVSSALIESFYHALSKSPHANPHSVMILRNGSVISEAYYKPYRADYPHMLYSMSKSVVSAAVGIAIAKGFFSIDHKLIDLFPESVTKFHDSRLNDLTVRHLLTMSSGIRFNELGSIISRDWVKGFMQSDFSFSPGEKFDYNSMNSYMLAAILVKKTGQKLIDFLNENLFYPLSIKGVDWERCPNGIEKGGWGLSLTIEEMAKIGQLFLQDGAYLVNGEMKQLIPKDWVKQATSPKIQTGQGKICENYGYQIWSFPSDGAYQFNGMFGQYLVVIPNYNFVIVVFGGSNNIMPEGSSIEIIRQYFGTDHAFSNHALPLNINALRSLRAVQKNLICLRKSVLPPAAPVERGIFLSVHRFLNRKKFSQPSLSSVERRYQGKTFLLEPTFSSILPFILQCAHGNFTDGISEVSFSFTPTDCTVSIKEDGTVHKIPAGKNGMPRYHDLTIGGETYRIGSLMRWTSDEDDRPVLKLFLSLIETPNTRIIKFLFSDDQILVKFDESPSLSDAVESIRNYMGVDTISTNLPLIDAFTKDRIKDRIAKLLYPVTTGSLIKKEPYSNRK